MTPRVVLVIDADPSVTFALRHQLTKLNFHVLNAGAEQEAIELAQKTTPELIFVNICSQPFDPFKLIRSLHGTRIAMAKNASLQDVKHAFEAGVNDLVSLPLTTQTIAQFLGHVAQDVIPLNDLKVEPLDGFIGDSPVMKALITKLCKIAPKDVPVLITGPTGTGKELTARFIHANSPRAKGPFIPVNCGAIPQNLVESQLFGHRKGAFTGALADKTGACQAAHNGTLFLDEIGDLPHDAQVKLLRFLDSRSVEIIGDPTPVKVNVRIVAATNKNLRQLVKDGSFREDLFYRLAVLTVSTPPLDKHPEDIPALAAHFLNTVAPDFSFTQDAIDKLVNTRWRGNVRQLRNAVIQASVSAQNNIVTAQDITDAPEENSAQDPRTMQNFVDTIPLKDCTLEKILEDIQRKIIQRAIRECNGNKSKAAKMLGLHRNSITRITHN